jgi:PAS domain S-box-containing protein
MADVGHIKPRSYEEVLQRLEEAEEIIRAIRAGEVDAFVVKPVSGEQVFTLQGGSDSYRAFMETMGHGAVALGSRGEILYANSVLAALVGKPQSRLQGQLLEEQFDAATGAQIRALLAEAETSNNAASSSEVSLKIEGDTRFYFASAEPLQTGVVNGWAVTFTDLTDRVRAEQSVAAERAARAIIASANEAVVVCDGDGIITHVNAAVLAIQDGDIIGRPFHEAIKLTLNDAIGLVQTEDLVKLAIQGSGMQGVEAFAPDAPRAKDLLISAAPLLPSTGAVTGCVITMVDLSHRKAAEKQQQLLMQELDHRVKNTLTLVLSILGRTSGSDIDTFKRTFASRIQALAATHNLLSENSWSTLKIAEVIAAELAPYVQNSADRLEQHGLMVGVKSRAAIATGLIFHELASNAAKYGALSRPNGKIILSVQQREADEPVTIEWRESGGPPVTVPEKFGFGTTVISKSLSYSPAGGADLKFEPTGIRCIIRIPPEDVVE